MEPEVKWGRLSPQPPGLDTETKRKATAALAAMGLTASEAVRLFFHRIAVDQAFPLELKVPNAETRRAMADSEETDETGDRSVRQRGRDLRAARRTWPPVVGRATRRRGRRRRPSGLCTKILEADCREDGEAGTERFV